MTEQAGNTTKQDSRTTKQGGDLTKQEVSMTKQDGGSEAQSRSHSKCMFSTKQETQVALPATKSHNFLQRIINSLRDGKKSEET